MGYKLTSNRPVTFFIIDGSRKYRNILVSALTSIDNIKVVGQAATLVSGFSKIARLNPDIIIHDYDIPVQNIKDTIDRLKTQSNDAEIILTTETKRTNLESTETALGLGALYFIRKPDDNSIEENVLYFKKYMIPVINLYLINRNARRVKKDVENKSIHPSLPKPKTTTGSRPFSNYDIVAIGTSLGGPEALKKLIAALPANFPVPIVIVQHMPETFTATLADNLDSKSELIVVEANGREKLRQGYVYLAPGGHHMEIHRNPNRTEGRYTIKILGGSPVNGCKPAVDVMFKSLAKSITGNILAVVLTGMGHDGVDGIRAMKSNGSCYCITQDESSCVVYGMPGEVVEAGLSDMILPLDKIPARLIQLVKGSPAKALPAAY